jgi:predicted O-methyltransferase YrrM
MKASEVLPRITGHCVDMWQHFPTLQTLAADCQSVVEMGVRGGCSAWALLAGLQDSQAQDRWMIYLDINDCKNVELEKSAQESGVGIEFIRGDSRHVEVPECDLLFIDTLHTYGQLVLELRLHHGSAKKFIVMHDVEAPWGYKNEVDDGSPNLGLKQAVYDFLLAHKEWKIKEWYPNCHGLAVLERA